MRNARLNEAQVGVKTARRNTNNLRYTDDTTLMSESEEELKSLLMRVKEESRKGGLKLNIQKTKIMASSPIASWQKSYGKPRKCVKEQKHHFADKGVYSQIYGLSSSHIQIWELDNK